MADLVADGLRHVALFYRERAEYLAAVTAFLLASLARDEPVFAAVPGQRIGEIAGILEGDAPRVSFVDMTMAGRNPAAIIPAVRAFADRHRGERFGFLGESAWPRRSPAELVEVAKHEALTNLAFAGTSASILCPYDASSLPTGAITDARCTHPVISERGISRDSQAYLGPHRLPLSCEQPLDGPPPEAEVLRYRTDLHPVRALVAARALAAGLTEARAGDLVLAVSEVAANTFRHTRGGGSLTLWSSPGEIVCEVTDGGWIADPLAGRVRPAGQLAGQQGLWVVNRLCDLVQVRSGPAGTTVRLHMSVARPGQKQVDGRPAGRERAGRKWSML